MLHSRSALRALLLTLGLVSAGASAHANNTPHDTCGVLVDNGSCVLFQSDNGNTYYYSGGFAPYSPGDPVHIVGEEGPCLQPCGSGLGCLFGVVLLESCVDDPTVPFCFGDGSAAACPCGNAGSPGEGCANSTGVGARLSALGTASVSSDDLVVSASGLTPGQPGLLFSADNAVGGGSGVLFGDGLRCAGGQVKRLGVSSASPGGEASWGPGLAGPAGWSAGDTRRLQVWYRDPGASPCGSGFNLSHGSELTLLP